jgi:alanine dehydrogenase
LANGLNVYEGAITHEAVAKDLGKTFKRPSWLS